ncbi:hypothetical protein MCOR23_000778 [Pyricularia oryzae]|uniref:WW domain-containing protein n=1 Tax=Pyricularia oryzae TaxID=318829 RepID=A0A4V1C5X2_PYROR|nr:hypothetical protein MCOR23_000778 [Pyricularia oryzae]QBZ57875.1 hypothetical protein PoMZ_02812 [Pyricularia oryzae]
MSQYEYSPLTNPESSIRLLELLPDEPSREIRVRLSHASLDDSFMNSTKRSSTPVLNSLASTLPPGWSVRESCSGRIAFQHVKTDTISWIHPDPSVSESTYRQLKDDVFKHPAVPEFEALSYTWGSAGNAEVISVEVDGTDMLPERRTLLIQPNLAIALKFLRHRSTSRTLWVDAVCINQQDVEERNMQVCRMAAIYTLARRVVLWLGPASHNSELAMSTMNHLGRQIVFCKNSSFYASPEAEHVDWYRSTTMLPYTEDEWRSILDLINRPWFERLWITQEVHLSNQHALVCCGLDEMPWDRFRSALIGLAWKQKTKLPELRRRLTKVSSLAQVWNGRPLQTLFKLCEDRQCSDPRDKIYGLLGLAPPALAKMITPNYLAPVADVYRDVVIALLRQTKRLCLANCGRSPAHPSLPTWVPDYSQSFASRFDDLGFCSGFSAAEFSTEGRSGLKVCGVRCLRVSDVSVPMRVAPGDAAEDLRHARTLRDWAARTPGAQRYPAGGTCLEALAAALVLGQTGDIYPSLYSFATLPEWSAQLGEFLLGPDLMGLSEIGDKTLLGRIFQGEQFLFSTREGFVGMAQCPLQPGDVLCVILGCMGMAILRPRTLEERQKYEVVGECYVHGFMEMQALLGPVPAPWVYRNQIKEDGAWYPWFVNSVSGQASEDDPRLGPVPEGWEQMAWSRSPEDPLYFVRFRNKVTGEIINSDPRLFPAALRARGVSLEMLELV